MTGWRTAFSLSTAWVLAGCVPAAHLATPAPVAATGWSAPDDSAATEPARAADAPLANLLGSPELGALSERALARNADIAIARARIVQSRALLLTARAAVLPEISLSGSATGERALGTKKPDARDALARLDIGIDFDLFGRIKAQKLAARERVRAAELGEQAVSLAVESELAAAYVQRSALQRRIEIVDRNIDRAVELERVIKVRLDEGAATRVDLGLQTIHLLNLRKDRSDLVEALDKTRTALALLAGEEAPVFQFAPGRIEDLSLPALEAPAPALLLERRPDVRAAEALIAAANGDVAQARASFFPSVGISLSGLLDSASGGGPLGKMVSVGSSILAPIFARGRLRGEFDFASAYQVETVETYRRTALEALTQVEDARSAIAHANERTALLDRIVDEARGTAKLANLQYLEGEEDLQSVLDAQQFLADAEEAQVVARQDSLTAVIELYRAIGGARGGAIAPAPRLAY